MLLAKPLVYLAIVVYSIFSSLKILVEYLANFIVYLAKHLN